MTQDDLDQVEASVWATLKGSRDDRAELCALLHNAEQNGLDDDIQAKLRLAIGRTLHLERLALEALARADDQDLNRVQFETSGFRLLTGKGSGINRRLWPKKRTTVSKLDAV